MSELKGLQGKALVEAKLFLETGLHIGGTDEFSAIGAIDSPVVRDTITRDPYIPGSSLKGKMRYLLARTEANNGIMSKIDNESMSIKRLFGSSGDNIVISRLQFYDVFLDDKSEANSRVKYFTDGSLTESKAENTINRLTAVATPRQIERVVKGVVFNFKVSYSVEDIEDVLEDFENLKKCIVLLENDYLGGSGTRGNGRVKFDDISINCEAIFDKKIEEEVESKFKEVFEV
ncbi:MAG: type III-A CRISPR-associated RAMP protein Csm3 [Lachnospirales bacterium]